MEYRPDQDIRINNIEARAIVVKDRSILLMFRRKHGEEYYVFPGGHMREGETPEQTCIREVDEETAIEFQECKPAFVQTDFAKKKPNTLHLFVAKWKSGEPRLNGEEIDRCTEDNYFEPMWIPFERFETLTVYTAAAKEWVMENVIKKA